MKFFQYFTTSSYKNPQPQIILILLSLLIPAEVICNFFPEGNTKHVQDQVENRSLNTAIQPCI